MITFGHTSKFKVRAPRSWCCKLLNKLHLDNTPGLVTARELGINLHTYSLQSKALPRPSPQQR
jgi:hypothetical protein